MDNNLYIKSDHNNIIMLEVHVDDIVFGSDDGKLIQGFAYNMQLEFELSMLGELTLFLGLKILQKDNKIHKS